MENFKIISNPPYEIYMEIMQKNLNKDFQQLWLVPVKWNNPIMRYLSLSNRYKNFISLLNDFDYSVSYVYTESEDVDFDAFFEQEIGIVAVNTEPFPPCYDKMLLNLINKIFPKIKSLNTYKRIKTYNDNCKNFITFKNASTERKYKKYATLPFGPYKYFINGKNYKNYSLQEAKDNCKQSTSGSIYNTWIMEFDNLDGLKNCWDSFSLTISKFITILSFIDRHSYPYLWNLTDDYSTPLTNKYFCDFYGIEGYISEDCGEPCSEYDYILKYVHGIEQHNKKVSARKNTSLAYKSSFSSLNEE